MFPSLDMTRSRSMDTSLTTNSIKSYWVTLGSMYGQSIGNKTRPYLWVTIRLTGSVWILKHSHYHFNATIVTIINPSPPSPSSSSLFHLHHCCHYYHHHSIDTTTIVSTVTVVTFTSLFLSSPLFHSRKR